LIAIQRNSVFEGWYIQVVIRGCYHGRHVSKRKQVVFESVRCGTVYAKVVFINEFCRCACVCASVILTAHTTMSVTRMKRFVTTNVVSL